MVKTRAFLERLVAIKMTANLTKNDSAHAYVTYLGHLEGQGEARAKRCHDSAYT